MSVRNRGFQLACTLVVVGLLMSGCSIVKRLHSAITAYDSIKKLGDAVQKSESATYEVTYVTTGSTPTTVTVAQIPTHDYFAGVATSGGSGGFEYVANTSGLYACTQTDGKASGSAGASGSSGSSGSTTTSAAKGGGGGWSCVKFTAAQASTYDAPAALYSAQYWYPVLEAFSAAGALAGLDVKTSSMSVNGFSLQCTSVTAPSGGTGTSSSSSSSQTGTWCVTPQGILGYVASSNDSSVFEIKSYSASPPTSLFQLPAGATVSAATGGSGVTGSSGTTSSS
jgi:hypothetical protein